MREFRCSDRHRAAFLELVGPNFGIHTVEGLPLLGLPPFRLSLCIAQFLKLRLTLPYGFARVVRAALFVLRQADSAVILGPSFSGISDGLQWLLLFRIL